MAQSRKKEFILGIMVILFIPVNLVMSIALQSMKPQTVLHFQVELTLPEGCTMAPYSRHFMGAKKPKNKHKFDTFTYYRSPQKTFKVLFLDDLRCIHQGDYPFTDPDGKIRLFGEFQTQPLRRLITLEAVYIAHFEDNLVIKKMGEVKIDEKSGQAETRDDNFELIKIGNPDRLKQFIAIMRHNSKEGRETSIRVIIDETEGDPVVLDYELFSRERKLKEHHK